MRRNFEPKKIRVKEGRVLTNPEFVWRYAQFWKPRVNQAVSFISIPAFGAEKLNCLLVHFFLENPQRNAEILNTIRTALVRVAYFIFVNNNIFVVFLSKAILFFLEWVFTLIYVIQYYIE